MLSNTSTPIHSYEPTDFDTYTDNGHHCVICYLKFDIKIHIPFILECGHTFCRICLASYDKSSCLLCKTETNSFAINYKMIDIILTSDKINMLNCFCDIPIEKKIVCCDLLCQRIGTKITCIKCYGTIHAGCEGRYIGEKAVYYISNFGTNHIKANLPAIYIKWILNYVSPYLKIKYNKKGMDALIIRLYNDWAYTEIAKSEIDYIFLVRHTLGHFENDDKYYFTSKLSVLDAQTDGMRVFAEMFKKKIFEMNNDVIITTLHKVTLTSMVGYVEKTINCFPCTIIKEVRGFVFEIFREFDTDLLSDDVSTMIANDNETHILNGYIQGSLISDTGIKYKFTCNIIKNSSTKTLKQNKSAYCYFIESHFHQTTIYVKLQGQRKQSGDATFVRHIIHKSEEKGKQQF